MIKVRIKYCWVFHVVEAGTTWLAKCLLNNLRLLQDDNVSLEKQTEDIFRTKDHGPSTTISDQHRPYHLKQTQDIGMIAGNNVFSTWGS